MFVSWYTKVSKITVNVYMYLYLVLAVNRHVPKHHMSHVH